MSTPITTIVSGIGQPNRYGITKIAGDGTVSYDFNFTVDQSDYLPRVNLDVSGVLSDNLSIYQNDTLIGSREGLNFEDTPGLVFSITDDGSLINISGTVNAGSGIGDVGGPSSAFDNAVVRFDGVSGKIIQNSRGILDDNGILSTSGLVITNGNVSGVNGYFTSNLTGNNLVANTNVTFGDTFYANSSAFRFNSTNFLAKAAYTLDWMSGSDYNTGIRDLRLIRLASGVLGVRDASNNAAGISGYFIGDGSRIVNIPASGDVFGPTSSLDNSIARYDGITGKLIQTSLASISDVGLIQSSGLESTLLQNISLNNLIVQTQASGEAILFQPNQIETMSLNTSGTLWLQNRNSGGKTNLTVKEGPGNAVNETVFTVKNKSDSDVFWIRTSNGNLMVDGVRCYSSAGFGSEAAALRTGAGATVASTLGYRFSNNAGNLNTIDLKLMRHASGILTVLDQADSLGSISGIFIGNGSRVTGLDAGNMANGSVSNTEFQYLDGVTSSVQTQLNAKQATLTLGSGLKFAGGAANLELYDKYDINVKDFGAVGDGVTNDSAAVVSGVNAIWNRVQTITSGPGAGFRGITPRLYFPNGKYRILNKSVLTPPSGVATSLAGFQIIGDGPWNSQIIYDYNGPDTDNTKFLINGANNIAYFSIEDISIVGASGTQYGILLYQDNSEGRTQQGLFKRVFFSNLKEGVVCSGSINVDSYKFLDSLFIGFPSGSNAIRVDNVQTLNLDFFSTDFIVIQGTGVHVRAGGAIRFFGGSHIAENNGLLLKIDGLSAYHGINNEEVSYFGTRFELLDDARLCTLNATKTVLYNDVTMTTVESSGNKHCHITDRGSMIFTNSFINDNFRSRITTDTTNSYTSEYLPTIEFYNSRLPFQLNEFADFTVTGGNDGGYGRYIAQGCKTRGTSYPANKDPLDCSIGSELGSYGGTFRMNNYVWCNNPNTAFGLPLGDAGGNFQSGVFKLPYGATIRKIGIERLNQNATWGGTLFTHRVYNHDRSIIFAFCSGHPGNVEQTFFSADLNYRVDSEAKRVIQVLGSGGAGALPGVGGRIFVDYV